MKTKVLLLGVALLQLFLSSHAQLPSFFNYQAVARDAGGKVLADKNIDIIIDIIEASVNGKIVWQEVHSVTTNDFGLFHLHIGSGISTGNGSLPHFDSIDWGSNAYFLKTFLDAGDGMIEMGTAPLLAVPYALYARKSGNTEGGSQTLSLNGADLSISGGNTVRLNVDDADADSTNEIQYLNLVGNELFISKANSVMLNLPFDSSSKIQTLSLTGRDLSISNANTVTLNVDDADADSTNELQYLSLVGSELRISKGNTINIPVSPWSKSGNSIYYKDGNMMLGTAYSYKDSSLFTLADSQNRNIPVLAYMYGKGADNFFNTSTLLHARIEASNGINTAIQGTASGNSGRDNRGVHGFATNSFGNTGLYGEAMAGSKNTSNNYGVYGIATGTTNAFNTGIFGESRNSTNYNRGIDGRTNGTGQHNEGVFGHSIGAGSGQNKGVYGFAQGSSLVNYGLLGETKGKGSWNIAIFADATGDGATNYGLYARAVNATTNHAAFVDGNLTYTGTLSGPSDMKLKKNMNKIDSPLDIINDIHPVSFEFSEDYLKMGVNFPLGLQYGFIAQEIEEVLPQLVSTQKMPVFNEDENGHSTPTEVVEFKGVNYIAFIPILTAALKEQQLLIEAQQLEIEKLMETQKLVMQQLVELQSLISEINNKPNDEQKGSKKTY